MSKNSPISFEFKKSFILVIIYWLLELICRLFMYINWELFQFTDNDANDEYHKDNKFKGSCYDRSICSPSDTQSRESEITVDQ